MVALGAVAGLTECVRSESIKEILAKYFKKKPAIVEANIKAFEAGFDAARHC
jgi:Pyruvate/2-oxoacid:ferredoxin oxidoreductase gamma subunit